MWRDLWTYRKRAVVIAALAVAALLAVGVVLAATLGGGDQHRGAPPAVPAGPSAAGGSTAAGYDHSPWDAVPVVAPQPSGPYPSIPATARSQPDLFVAAFGTELLTRDYRHSSREQLLAWAQSESSSLSIQQVPLTQDDRDKALLVSITNPAWDDTSAAIVPTQGEWLSLAAEQGHTTVSGVRVEAVPDFPPPGTTFADRLTLDRLFTATVTLHTTVSGKAVLARTSVAFEVVVGTSQHHGPVFGAAETQHYVVKDVP